jgi:hypothetical protein
MPKKVQCQKCLAFNSLTEDEQHLVREEHDKHLERRKLARQERDKDKTQASGDLTILAFNFDLQAVVNTPKGPFGPIFYLRKLAVYNLNIFQPRQSRWCLLLMERN